MNPDPSEVESDANASMLATYVTAQRRLRGWTQNDLVEMSGLSLATIQSIEAGRAGIPRQRTSEGLEKAFELPEGVIRRILAGEPPNEEPDPSTRDAAELLQHRRLACRLSLADAATLAGVSTSTVKAMEGPRGHLTPKTLSALETGLALRVTEDPARELLPAESVRTIANVLLPLIEVGGSEVRMAMLEYQSLVSSLAAKANRRPRTPNLWAELESALSPLVLTELARQIDSQFDAEESAETRTDDQPESVAPPAPVRFSSAYLVIYDQGGIGWAGLDADRADEFARNTDSIVVQVPVVADYRQKQL